MKGLGGLLLVALVAHVTGRRLGQQEGELAASQRLAGVYMAGFIRATK